MAQKVKHTPSISVCIATYNSGKTLDRCLSQVRAQNYPQDKIEILLGDGGSTDNTFKIAKKYSARVVSVPSEKQHAEYNRGVAFNKATGELALIIDHDNFLPDKNWLTSMIAPLLENPEIVASSTCYYDYNPAYDLMDRYFGLFGTSEPLPYYLGKADRLKQTDSTWTLQGNAVDHGTYYLVTFSKDPRMFPSVGSNGCLMRRKLVLDNAQADPDHHYPIDVLFDVVKKGHTKFAFVKTSIIHLTHSRGLIEFLRRRVRFVAKYHFEEQAKRRWSVVMKGDEVKLALFILYSITFIKPLYDSLNGFRKIHDVAWFVHPIMCFATTVLYGYSTIRQIILRKNISI